MCILSATNFTPLTNSYYKVDNGHGCGPNHPWLFLFCLMAVIAITTCFMPFLLSLPIQIWTTTFRTNEKDRAWGRPDCSLDYIHAFLTPANSWMDGFISGYVCEVLFAVLFSGWLVMCSWLLEGTRWQRSMGDLIARGCSLDIAGWNEWSGWRDGRPIKSGGLDRTA